MKQNYLYSLLSGLILSASSLPAFAGDKLSGIPIGTSAGFNYELGRVEYDIQWKAFDGDLSTYFATNQRSYTWVGLDLGTPHIIDRVGWSPRNDGLGPGRVRLGVIQGANSDDFLDAVPLYIITENGIIGQMSYADVNCSKGFRYVRFVSTSDSRCNIAELEFYGTPGEGTDDALFQITDLPTVCINTVNAEEPYDKEHDIVSNVIIINEGKAFIDKPATVRERGNGSRTFPKKPWRIKFDKKQQVLPDAPAKAKKWTLINNYGDKTLMRNMVAFEIARRLGMPYVPYAHAVDVILNGEFKGCYQLCDQVEVNANRLDITEMEPDDNSGEALTGGYFFEVDAYADREPANEWFTSARLAIPVTIKSPDDGGTPEQYAYINNYFNMVEERVYNNRSLRDTDQDYRLIFDIESFINHFIVGELSGNTDTYWSTFMYKDRGSDIVYTGPVWDFDLAFDNDSRTYPIHSTAGSRTYLFNTGGASSAHGMRSFVSYIVYADSRTADDISSIWSYARDRRDLTYEGLCEYIDNLSADLDHSQQLNFVRWPIMNQWVHMNPVLSGSYDNEVARVKTYLRHRFEDLDLLMKYVPLTDALSPEHAIVERLCVSVADGCITLPAGLNVTVFSLSGVAVWSGSGCSPRLTPGVYVVRSATGVAKVVI